MVKAIIFDFGDVICNFDNYLFLERISKYTDKSVDELFQLIYGQSDKEDQFEKRRITGEFESGRISGEEFYQAITELCGLKGISLEEFRHAFTDIFTPIPSTFELIRQLDKDYTLALLSNTSVWDFEYGLKKIDVFDLFDAVTASYEVGVMKPDPKIYKDCLDKLKLPPEECVYIDDVENYAKAASDLGIHGIHYTTHEKLVEYLRKLGVQA